MQKDKEPQAALLAFLHFFLVIFSYYIIKPVRDALFVKTIGPRYMPYFYLAVAALTFFVVAAYNQLLQRLDKRRFVVAIQVLVVVVLAGFWLAMNRGLKLAAPFFIWASIYNVLVVAIFWSLTNDLFTPQQGRRLYGLIGGGGIVGGIAGSAAASVLPLAIGAVNCLLVGAVLMGLAALVTLLRLQRPAGMERDPAQEMAKGRLAEDLGLIFKDPHVQLIAKIVLFTTIAKTAFNFHYYHLVDAAIDDTNAAAAFFGQVYTATNISSALLQFGVTTWVLRVAGARWGLVFLPAALLFGMGSLFFDPPLLLAAAANVAQQSTSYSINQASKELLYTPTSAAVKYRAKAVIDIFVFRFGDALAAVLLLLLHEYLRLPLSVSLWFGVALATGWLVMVLRAEDPTKTAVQ